MKLISSKPPGRDTSSGLTQNWLRQRLRSRVLQRLFSKQTAWWIFVGVVAWFAYTIVHLFRQMIETMQGQ